MIFPFWTIVGFSKSVWNFVWAEESWITEAKIYSRAIPARLGPINSSFVNSPTQVIVLFRVVKFYRCCPEYLLTNFLYVEVAWTVLYLGLESYALDDAIGVLIETPFWDLKTKK